MSGVRGSGMSPAFLLIILSKALIILLSASAVSGIGASSGLSIVGSTGVFGLEFGRGGKSGLCKSVFS